MIMRNLIGSRMTWDKLPDWPHLTSVMNKTSHAVSNSAKWKVVWLCRYIKTISPQDSVIGTALKILLMWWNISERGCWAVVELWNGVFYFLWMCFLQPCHDILWSEHFSLHLLNVSTMKVIDSRALNSIFVLIVFWCTDTIVYSTHNFIVIQCKYIYFATWVQYVYYGANFLELNKRDCQAKHCSCLFFFWAFLCEAY